MFIQVLILVFCGVARGGLLHGGSSTSARRQDDFGNYAFNYGIVDPLGATNGRWETGDAWGNKRGGYTLTDIDGRARRVEYVADAAGFRTVVKTNEPGTAASAPAAAIIASPYRGTVVHSPIVAAPAYRVVPRPPFVPPVAYKGVIAGRPYGYGVAPGFYKG